MLSREWLDASLVLVAALALVSALLLILTVPRPHVVRRLPGSDGALIGGAIGLAALVAFAVTGELPGALTAAAAAGGLCALIRRALPNLTAPGVIHTALAPAALIASVGWSLAFAQQQALPGWISAVIVAGGLVGVVLFGFGFAASLAQDAVYTHGRWRRPTHAPPPRYDRAAPKVSIHVPCYAEPPEMVLQTLQRLAELRYPNYEVIVCDNNTADEALWRPLERFCNLQNRRRPGRFRFFHVAPLQGAKAGALNFCLERTASDAELVAVIDADYLAEPDFLNRLAPFFAEAKVGFVQTPHDYRRDGSAYQAMCYWEYMPSNKVGLAAINEYDCAYTIGTMCIVRKEAIAQAGGWAEWCLTEDSEISIRIRALGYEGVYVNETFGRGLIPETFEDLKKQRFRWTAGPVQQLLAHWRLFLPRALGGSPAMHGWVKLMEVSRSLASLQEALGFCAGLVALGAMVALTLGGRLPQLALPAAFWTAAGLGAAAGAARLWQQYRLAGCVAPHQIAGAEIARLSLGLVKATAAAAALTGRPLKWRRTPKFAASSSAARALFAAAAELAAGLAFALLAAGVLQLAPALGPHIALVAAVGLLAASLGFLTAPVMAWLCERRLRSLDAGRIEAAAEPIIEPALPRAA
jgi:hypothetical protein